MLFNFALYFSESCSHMRCNFALLRAALLIALKGTHFLFLSAMLSNFAL